MKLLPLFFSLLLLNSCYKLKTGYKDTEYRNKYAGEWRIDSIVKESVHIDSIITDTKRTQYFGANDYIYIPKVKDQINKNKLCSGKLFDTFVEFEIQGFKDENADRLSFNPCNNCSNQEMFLKYLGNLYYIISFESNSKLLLKSRYFINGKEKGNTLYLTKK